MTFYSFGVDINRDLNRDDIFVTLQDSATPAFRTGSGGSFTGDGARIEAPAPILAAIADGLWNPITDLSTVVENNGLTAGTADLTIATDGFYVIGVDVDVTQSVLYDPELEVRIAINATEKYLSEKIRIYEADVLQNEKSRTVCYLNAGDVLTVEYKATLDTLDINYIGLYAYVLGGGGGGGGPVTAATVTQDNINNELDAANVQLALDKLASRFQTNTEAITATKTLLNSDPSIQLLENTTAGNLDVDLVSISEVNKFFAIISGPASTQTITIINGPTISPLNNGDSAELIYDGTTWILL